MRGIEHEIYLLIITHEDMGWGEILSYFPKKKHRAVGRAIKRLVENNDIGYDRIRGKGKWKRYFLKEENTKNDLLISAMKEKDYKMKRAKFHNMPITQKNLSKLISQYTKLYRTDEFKSWKEAVKIPDSKTLHSYINLNVGTIIHCLKWISQLTWAINSGMLGNSKTKLALAKRNKERYEELLSTVVYNLTAIDEGMMKAISKLIYNEIMYSMIFEESTIGGKKIGKKGKGKWFYQFNRKSKYYF